ncbi:MAG: hypothetical protein QUS33_06490 [Dehalococcoidia bacterium]|nr:hypothetical protein [Dehalococcoidia bacterium]
MKETYQTKLWVNGADIELNPFVGQFLAGTVVGGVRTLKGVAAVRSIGFNLAKGNATLMVNGKQVELTPFPSDMLSRTVIGAVSSLKGVSQVDSLQMDIKVV